MGTRITLTKAEWESETGTRLVDMILAMCHDGRLEIGEVKELHGFLRRSTTAIAAVPFLRAITREVVADGAVDSAEAYRLKAAFERVVPKQARGIVSTHLVDIGLPTVDAEAATDSWTADPATARQIAFLRDLGGSVSARMTKGEASNRIDELLRRRPPTPRQIMVLRFFDRLDLAGATKAEVRGWIDEWYAADQRLEMAWERFKRTTHHDPRGLDPTVVPLGAFRRYMGSDASPHSGAKTSKGCLGALAFVGLALSVLTWIVLSAVGK